MSITLDDFGRFFVCEQEVPSSVVEIVSGERLRNLEITGRRRVDPDKLEVVEDIFSSLGQPAWGGKALDTADNDTDRLLEGVHFIVGAISFATGSELEVMTAFGDQARHEFVPQDDGDGARLAELGTRWARIPIAPTSHVEVFADAPVDGWMVQDLASRKIAGVYADALGDMSPRARFFSLWRTLEFAFEADKTKELIPLLLSYPRVTDMEFDRKELEDLRVLRGRIGHASSRKGLGEVLTAGTEAIRRVGRLWSLVDWVVLSKEGPGKNVRCDPLAELCAFIDRSGRVKLIGGGDEARAWLEQWSERSPRFLP